MYFLQQEGYNKRLYFNKIYKLEKGEPRPDKGIHARQG